VSQDFRINALTRAVFVRHNVNLNKVEHGTTNGVIYVRGALCSGVLDESEEGGVADIAFARRIEKALRRLPGVRDVVFNLKRVVKVGARWKAR